MVDSSHPNLPTQDEATLLLLSEGVIREFEKAEEGFLHILMAYNSQNIQNRRKVIGTKNIKAKNHGITARNFLRYCRAASLVPNLLNIENLQDCIASVLPPRDKEERKFYETCVLIKQYETEGDFSSLIPLDPYKGEPDLKLHHLQLIFGRIAIQSIRDIDDPVLQVRTLLFDKLKLGKGQELGPGLSVTYSTDYQSDVSLGSIEDPEDVMADYEHKQMVSRKDMRDDMNLNEVVKQTPPLPTIEDVIKMLDDERVPQVPPVPPIVQENPPPYALPVTQFALPKPPEPKPKNAMPQRSNKKKEETAADRLKFAPLPGSFIPSLPDKPRYEKFFELKQSLACNLYPETAKQCLVNPGVHPCIIREILLPPPSPPGIGTLIESCFVYQNNYNYPMALMSLDNAKREWQDFDGSDDLKPEIDLFFEITRGAIYQSCNKDGLALAQYFSCKASSDKLPFNHPDKALIWCGLGSVLFHLGHYSIALRAYLMAKKIRERTIGGDTVDTASVYNNLGVCMFFLERYQESHAYFQLAEAILDMLLGPHHPRTLTAKQNIAKVKRQSVMGMPEFKPLWQKQYVDPYPKAKKKGKKKGKKK
eukprot:CAMPEP_0202944452 /NCGR_PEP_ID=MMETSP1395-20130829/5242_1 /ASSEMBLY_ACC=CAM_ASM_000871 /TAXON_ID=5961 /ORGANISM="Blepharisma japonicum, Strain Stock R1072" /LENGTH=590 /DNA_ID=CAMNT_0049643271 /DNA_START=270 /DNA_END=2039 /DNA_ORIENTATION=+